MSGWSFTKEGKALALDASSAARADRATLHEATLLALRRVNQGVVGARVTYARLLAECALRRRRMGGQLSLYPHLRDT